MTLLGASYFRVVGKGHVYGLSARGLAIDTALPSGEEFPRFTEFWVEKPKPADKHLVIYALLDSPRSTGAYKLTCARATTPWSTCSHACSCVTRSAAWALPR